jgi:hypothetical protein
MALRVISVLGGLFLRAAADSSADPHRDPARAAPRFVTRVVFPRLGVLSFRWHRLRATTPFATG